MNEKTRTASAYRSAFSCAAITFGVTLLAAAAVCMIRSIFPLGGNRLMYSDFGSEYWPFMVELYDKIHNGGSLFYSWRTALGTPFWGTICYYLLSPFNLLLLLLPRAALADAMGVLIFLRQGLAGASMAFFLCGRKKNTNIFPAVACGVLYAFCGWLSAYYFNVIWLDAFWLLPLVAFGIERLLSTGKAHFYVAALCLTLISNFYIGYISSLFAVLFFFYYLFCHYDKVFSTAPDGTPVSGRLAFFHCRFFRDVLRFACASILTPILLGVLFVPLLQILLQTQDNSFTEDSAYLFKNLLFQASELMSGAAVNRNDGNMYLPIYSGVLPLVTLPLLPFVKRMPKKEKLFLFSVLFFFFLSFNIPFLNQMWHGFRTTTGVPFRESFLFSFFMLLCTYQVLTHIRDIPKTAFWADVGACVLWSLLVGLPLLKDSVAQNKKSGVISGVSFLINFTLFIAITLTLFLLYKRQKAVTGFLAIFLVLLSVVDAVWNWTSVINVYPASVFFNYQAFCSDASELLVQTRGESPFFRTDLRTTNQTYGNYGSYLAANGIYQSSSVSRANYVFFRRLGMDTNQSNFVSNRTQTPAFNSLFGVRYLLENDATILKGDTPRSLENGAEEGYTRTASDGEGLRLYKYRYALPVGFVTDGALRNWQLQDQAAPENQNAFFRLACDAQNVLTRVPVSLKEADAYYVFTQQTGDENWKFNFKSSNPTLQQIVFSATPEKSGQMYVYMDIDVEKTAYWALIAVMPDGTYRRFTDNINTIMASLGPVEGNQEIMFSFLAEPGFHGTCTLQTVLSEPENLKDAYRRLEQKGFWQLDEATDARLSGTIRVSEPGQIFCTSVPYSKNWRVTVDGKTLPPEEIFAVGGGLLGFTIDEGEHAVAMEYRQAGLGAGIAVSCAGLAAAAAWLLLPGLLKKKRKRKEAEAEQ